MKSEILVSACIITYNHENYIEECIKGALGQEIKNYEIIIGDDCSNDNTSEICQKYADLYPDIIKYQRRIENLGMIGNWLTTLKNAQGKYIAICEGDDYWTDPLKLQKQVDFLKENEDFVITGHDAKVIDSIGNLVKESQLPESVKRDASSYELKKGFWISTLTMCFRNVITEYPKELYEVTNCDTFLTSLLGNHGNYKYMKNVEKGAYRLHEGGIWSAERSVKRIKHHINTFNQLSNYYYRLGDKNFAKEIKPSKFSLIWRLGSNVKKYILSKLR